MMIIIIVYRTVDNDDDDDADYLIRKHFNQSFVDLKQIQYFTLFCLFLSSGKCKLHEIIITQSIHLYSHIILSLLP